MLSHKGPTVALILSVAVNLALAGFIMGRTGLRGFAEMAPDPSLGAFRVLRELPESRRDALRPMMRDHFREVRPDLRRLRAAQEDIGRALAAEPYAPEALAEALSRFRDALLASQAHSHQALMALAAQMTPEERRRMLDAMDRHPRGRSPPPDHSPR